MKVNQNKRTRKSISGLRFSSSVLQDASSVDRETGDHVCLDCLSQLSTGLSHHPGAPDLSVHTIRTLLTRTHRRTRPIRHPSSVIGSKPIHLWSFDLFSLSHLEWSRKELCCWCCELSGAFSLPRIKRYIGFEKISDQKVQRGIERVKTDETGNTTDQRCHGMFCSGLVAFRSMLNLSVSDTNFFYWETMSDLQWYSTGTVRVRRASSD